MNTECAVTTYAGPAGDHNDRDLNEPGTTTTGYLGGMALSGVLGWWDSGLGAGPPVSQAVLVGARDLDPAEQAHIEAGRVVTVSVGEWLDDRLAEAIEERPVYLHLDCDVLEPGIVQTDYQVTGGLTLQQLAACAEALAHTEVIGLEIGEFEGPGTVGAYELVEALAPLL